MPQPMSTKKPKKQFLEGFTEENLESSEPISKEEIASFAEVPKAGGAGTAPVSSPLDAAEDVSSVFSRVAASSTASAPRPVETPASGPQPASVSVSTDSEQEMQSPLIYKEWKAADQKFRDAAERAPDPKTRQVYLDAQDEAKRLFNERATRAEWLSVAERIGNALIRLRAADQGLKRNVDLSNVALEKPIDWDSKIGRYQQEYTTELDKLRRNYAEQERTSERLKDLELRGLDREADMQKYRYGQALQSEEDRRKEAARSKERAAERAADIAASERRQGASEAAADRRERERREYETKKEERFRRKETLQELRDAEKDQRKQLEAAQQLANYLKTEEDLSPKARGKLQEKYGQLAAIAGEDLGSLAAKLEEQDTGFFGSSEKEKAGRNAILDGVVSKKRNLLDAIQARRKDLDKEAATPEASKPAADTPTAPPPAKPKGEEETIQVRAPDGSIARMTREAAARYLSKPGFSEVR